VELDVIRTLMDAGQVPICCGGGGIPVALEGLHRRGMGAVIDKDHCAALLAQQLKADMLVILTAVEKVAIHFGKPEQQWLDRITVAEAQQYLAEGHFAVGSMAPKMEAAIAFAASGSGRKTLITKLELASAALAGKTGTIVE